MNVVAIIQARMTSTRLPGKVLREVLGKPLLEYQIERLRRCRRVDRLVVATTKNAADDPVIALCDRLGIASFRGSEYDVLARYYEAATIFRADPVVRLTADCPIIDPEVVDKVVGYYADTIGQYDHVSNAIMRTYPRGMDTEVFPYAALAIAHREAEAAPQREHVTPFLHRQPARFRLGHVLNDRDESRHRWTVDTPEDFDLISRIVSALYPSNPEFTMQDCLDLLSRHPDWYLINAEVSQKKYGQ